MLEGEKRQVRLQFVNKRGGKNGEMSRTSKHLPPSNFRGDLKQRAMMKRE